MRIRGQSVVVTGASAGIGRATAVLLAARGARVWAVARNEGRLKELAAEHMGIIPWRADISLDEDRAALVEAVGRVDVLVNNAGVGWIGAVADMPFADVRTLFEVNVLGLVDLTLRFLPGMLERRHGHIVNMASIAGYVSAPPLTVYSATKFAVHGFSDGLRRETAGRGVTVALVNPGPINTEFGLRALGAEPRDGPATSTVSARWVAGAVLRSIRGASVPGYQTIAVPRAMGLLRLGQVPGAARLVDLYAMATRPAMKGLRG